MIGVERLRQGLMDLWGLPEPVVERHDGGMNSSTWFVTDRGERWVAKAVDPAARRSFTSGLAVAAALQHAGVPAGAPMATRQGERVVDVDGTPLALLTWVPGEELTSTDPGDQRLIGAVLARVHRALAGVAVPDAERFHWVDPQSEHLDVRPWVRPAVARAVAAYDELDPQTLSWGLLHTDPAFDAFRMDRARGVCGMIDWSTAMIGPLLYDVASAVMYAGGLDRSGALVEAYLDEGVMPRAEAERALGVMLRFRWAVQADYFARRIVTNDLTGVASAAENEKGLADAFAWL
ncbi:phosphotransferase enzyme family protein [Paractinoplanes lichenicola]|uniref:Phosphotransferase n=1 Tax=Paractinoplanes lichenicola TaxID=2802976 RepID=A0ABS1VZX8_9ACTN|nr:phosphotransferase [Actinoplanes lichenicola]MBL7259863.1 phosphotransferase [Actinoplanes lichenicola]